VFRDRRTARRSHRSDRTPRSGATATLALALTALLVVDPFTLGGVAGAAVAAAAPVEDRAANFRDALDTLPAQTAAPATLITGSWPAAAPVSLTPPDSDLPVEDETTIAVSSTAPTEVDLGGLPVTVALADGSSPDSVTLRVADAETAQAAGVTGVLLDIEDATGGDTSAEASVTLTVSYARFAGLAGGDWSSRLHLVYVPDCLAEASPGPDCEVRPIDSVNDAAAQTVTGVVPVDPAGLAGGQGMAVRAAVPGDGGGAVAVTAGVAGSGGDWSQTGLPQSSSWGTSGNTGGFTWSYPLTVPAPLSGLAPELTLAYSSAVSDGRVPSTNNQSGWIGEGFDLTSSYIERQYMPCADDTAGGANNADRETGDLCWGPANATMVFKGGASALVKGSGNLWHSKNEDGTRAELVTGGWHGGASGEYWKVTTTDGTQYFFGRGKLSSAGAALNSAWTVPVYGNHSGEPCHQSSFASSDCAQVWRWNLDHVVDPSGNTITYTYATESNAYVADYGHNTAWTPVAYTSGGRLTKIEYGTRTGSTGSAPFQVVFDAQKRCLTDPADGASLCAGGHTETDKTRWLDTPTDLQCTVSTTDCMNVVPVFFDTTRLAKVTTQAWDGTAYRAIDSWAFTQRFAGDGNDAQVQYVADITLRLEAVTRTGHGGTAATTDDITLLPVQFGYTALPNRVDTGADGQSALYRHRVIRVRTETGGAVNVGYRDAECTPANVPAVTDTAQAGNTKLCYLVKWQPQGESQPQNHWFHKYVVESLVEDAAPHSPQGGLITGSVSKTTRYTYLGGALWAKPTGPMIDPAETTYTEFRGFAQVETRLGEGASTPALERATYFRGTGLPLSAGPDGHVVTVTDRVEYVGQVFASQARNGSAIISEVITKPAAPVTVATGAGGLTATRVPQTTTYGFSYTAMGAIAHRTSTTTTNDAAGLPVTIDDAGDLDTGTDDTCTQISYRRDGTFTTANKLAFAAKTEVFAAGCDGTLTPATLISRDSASYDDAARVTETLTVSPTDPTADVVRSRTTYDTLGRPVTSEDAAGAVTTTAYTSAAGGQISTIVTTSPDPDGGGPTPAFTSTQTFHALTGLPTTTTDQNGLVTTATYDALARITSVRYPQHAAAPKPSVEYEYTVTANGLNAVLTRTLGADGTRQHTSVILYDGMGRPFQSQTEGADTHATDPGRVVAHLTYDDAGRVVTRTSGWWAAGAPAATPIVPGAGPTAYTTYAYDDAGRVTAEIFGDGPDLAHERWRTSTVYDGVTTLTIPPLGGVPTETVTDARGRTIELREYVRDPDTHAAATTAVAVRALEVQTTRYTYDTAGQLVAMTNPAGDDWQYSYDLAGQRVSATDPDGGTTTTGYTLLGQVRQRTNANGDTLAYTYDLLGRVTTLRDDSTTGTVRASWTYDQSDLTGSGTALGQLTAATRAVDGVEYTTGYPQYDAAYRPTRVDTTLAADSALLDLAGDTFSTRYEYTADGQVAQVTYPQVTDDDGTLVLGQETVTTRFDDRSMPSWMSGGFGWGTYVADARWEFDGKPRAHDLGNTYGAAVTYLWDAVTRELSNVSLNRERVEGAEVDVAYTYDAAGNVTSVIDAPTHPAGAGQGDAQCFRYDGMRRLQTAWTDLDADCERAAVTSAVVGGVAPYWSEFAYDELGNRTGKTDRAGSVTTVTEYTHGAGSAGPHQLTAMTETTGGVSVSTGFTWDPAGNQTSRTVDGDQQTLEWDPEGELVGVTGAGGDVANVFAADGTRLVRVDEGGVTVFLPGGQEVRSDGAGVTATRWYTFAGTTVATRTGVGMGAVASVVTDPHGTPVAHVHNTNWAAPVNRIRTDPFGNARTGQTGTHAGRGFLGAPTDPTGLALLGARFYDPATGTFVSVDPLLDPMLPAQYNAYVYAGNNPLTWADPTGEAWQTDPDNPRANTINTGLATVVASPARRQGGSGVATTTNVGGLTSAPAYAAGGCGYSYNPCGAPTRSPAETAAMASAAAHGTLTALGLVPGVGEIADGLDALVCLAENDMICAGLSAAATIPFAGWAAALGKFGRIGANLADVSRLSDEQIALATQHVTNSGDTVLGHFPGYIEKASDRGSSYFDVGGEWDAIVARGEDPWAYNQAFLDSRIAAGDRMLLSVVKQDIRPGSYLEREIQYLMSNGYGWTNQWALAPKG
jgi:RHS repeat-associated protein